MLRAATKIQSPPEAEFIGWLLIRGINTTGNIIACDYRVRFFASVAAARLKCISAGLKRVHARDGAKSAFAVIGHKKGSVGTTDSIAFMRLFLATRICGSVLGACDDEPTGNESGKDDSRSAEDLHGRMELRCYGLGFLTFC
jgi:hypothetical protein